MKRSTLMTSGLIVVLAVCACMIWIAVLNTQRGVLTVSFLDVGQGDAVFIESPTGTQMLIDGGSGTAVLRELGRVMPWYDRTIDVIIGTHADLDHIGGLIELLPRYRIATALVPSTQGNSDAWRTYLRELSDEALTGARVFDAVRGERVDLGGGAYVDILFPDRAVPHIETNTGCVVARLVYGATAFMLPCDSPQAVENYLALLDGNNLKANVLKAGHHGSKTSSAPLFVGLVNPEVAVFSRGCDNRYGHPSKETVVTFARFKIPTLDTCTDGTITFVSNGDTVRRK